MNSTTTQLAIILWLLFPASSLIPCPQHTLTHTIDTNLGNICIFSGDCWSWWTWLHFPNDCFAGQSGQCRAYRGCLLVVVAVAVCMKVRSLALSPCPAHNAVIHTKRGAQGPRSGWPLLQRWPRGHLLWPAWDWTWQLWGRLLCKLTIVRFYFLFMQFSLLILNT